MTPSFGEWEVELCAGPEPVTLRFLVEAVVKIVTYAWSRRSSKCRQADVAVPEVKATVLGRTRYNNDTVEARGRGEKRETRMQQCLRAAMGVCWRGRRGVWDCGYTGDRAWLGEIRIARGWLARVLARAPWISLIFQLL